MNRILFAGYAPVHFLCFRPVYELLRQVEDLEVWLSGGFRKAVKGEDPTYDLAGFYEPFGVDESRVAPFADLKGEPFDTVVCSHSSDVFFPEQVGSRVQIFHGVSFKNFAVRDKVLKYDYACVAGRYHGERFDSAGLIGGGDCDFLLTGFPKLDALATGSISRERVLDAVGVDPALPTILYAPTGGKHNSLDTMGEEIIQAIAREGRWNLLIKPHDHPKKNVNWQERLAPLEDERTKVVRDFDVVPFLQAADVLLTDASSVAMEYTLLDRPIVFVDVPKLMADFEKRSTAHDLDTYGRKIGSIAEGVADVAPRIAEALEHPDRESALRRRAAEHLFHSPGRATENVAAVILRATGLREGLPDEVEPLSPSGAPL